MDLLILNQNFEAVKVIDRFESFLWTVRYNGYGDFELYTVMDSAEFGFFQLDNYIWAKEMDVYMIIEEVSIDTDIEDGNHVTVKGRTLESILNRRVFYRELIYKGSFQQGIEKLLIDTVIDPPDLKWARQISGFVFSKSVDPRVTSKQLDVQIKPGENLYDVIKRLCDGENMGFKINLSEDHRFVFQLYYGENRSYDQEDNPYVTFSPNFDNLINSNYLNTKTNYKNTAYTFVDIDTEYWKSPHCDTVVYKGSMDERFGLKRREMYHDSTGLSPDDIEEVTITAQMQKDARDALSEYTNTTFFEGQIETTNSYKYGEDFFIGDIVQLINEYGIEAKVRVTEMLVSHTVSGMEAYPTFVNVEEGDDEV